MRACSPSLAACCLGLLLLAGGAVAASAKKCVANPESPLDWGDSKLGACRKCMADKSACAECWPGWSLSEQGKCVECTGSLCLSCDPENPAVCTECGDWSGESEVGYYALDDGTCAECPADNCMQCHNGNGTCTQCTTGMGVVDGVCQPCSDEEACLFCNGDLDVCTECLSGYFLDAGEGKCKKCPANCDRCSDADTCLECRSDGWVLDEGSAQCVPCSVGCTSCPKGANTCDSCDTGYTSMPDGTCARCTDPHCTTCAEGKPDVCTICASTSSDSWWGGPNEDGSACVPCAAKHCAACQESYETCDWCEDGYFNDAESGECTPCSDRWDHCSWCGLDATKSDPGVPACFGCDDGFELNEKGQCTRAS